MKGKLSRRHRLLWKTLATSLLALAGITLFVFYRRPSIRYDPGDRAEGITAELERQLPADYPRVAFAEVARQSGVSFQHFYRARSTQLPEDMGSGAAWADYDNDGDDDLLLVNVSGPLTLDKEEALRSPAMCRLYENRGKGAFVDATERSRLGLRICGMGVAWGDYDNDGWLDVAISSYPDLFLFRNNRDGTFSDATDSAGFGKHKGFWAGVSWADYDKDGDLDLYVCGYVRYRFDPQDTAKLSMQFEAEVPYTLNPSSYPPQQNLLFRNEGGGKFTEVARLLGVDNPTGRSLAAAWCDFDADGWLDLYVANDVSDNAMLRSLAGRKFEDVSHAAWVADYRGAMGLAVGDWDADGDFDIFVTHWLAQENALFSNMRIGAKGAKPGKMVFMDIADQQGLGQVSLDYVKWGTVFFDYDNDTKLDLFVANGSTFQDREDRQKLIPMRHLLFWNRGDPEGYFEVSSASGEVFRQATVGRGAAFSDYDDDGDVDVCVANHSGPAWLLRNDGGNRQHWLKVRLQGRKNRFGLGALVRVLCGDKVQLQQIGSQPSYLSQNSLTAHFGLGRFEAAREVTVTFPSGKEVRLNDVPGNQTLIVEEP